MNDVSYALENSLCIIAHAPTGLGKTAAALSPSLEYGMENGKTVLFLTPRHSQHQIALETLKKIKEKGTNFRAADIIGKKWLCSVGDVGELKTGEFNEFCRALRNEERCMFFNNTRTKEHTLKNEAKSALVQLEKKFYHAEEAKEFLSGSFCTYEILSDLARKSNVIIADYYHLFSQVRNSFLARIGKNPEDLIIIIDEAHNLADRIRGIASRNINTFTLNSARKEAQMFGFYEEAESIKGIESAINYEAKNVEKDAFLGKEALIESVESETGKFENVLENLHLAAQEIKVEQKKSFISSIVKFFDLWIESEKGYAKVISKRKTKSERSYVSLSNRCLDPSLYSSIINEVHSSILMSGTLLPIKMHMDLLGVDEKKCLLKSYTSPFPTKNRLAVIVKDTTTKYSRRTEENYRKISDYVTRCCNSIEGNCAVFFPSYLIRDIIYSHTKQGIRKTMLLEKQGSDKSERKKLYNTFVKNYEEGSVLFGVISGSFDEGIDMPGKYLNGVVVVGIPLEKPDLETTALIDYYDYKFKRGWDYGYTYPAMIRCLQAAGRAIRSENDRGVVVFIDERFAWSNYRKVFPSDMNIKIPKEPEILIEEFFKK